MKLEEFKLDPSGLYVGDGKGTPAGYLDGAEKYLCEVLEKSKNKGILSTELKEAVKDWPSLYHLSPYRVTILDCLDFSFNNAEILELGAGCGAISRWLGDESGKVTAIEGNYHRAQVAGIRCSDLSNVRVHVANFFDLSITNHFDVATLIGVLEYSHLYHPEYRDSPYKAALSNLRFVFDSLKNTGVLILALENKMGLKYFGGAREDHSGRVFDSIQGYPRKDSAVTYSAYELEKMLKEAGFSETEIYLPFPDYKLATTILNGQELSPKYYPHNWIETPFSDRCTHQRSQLFNESLVLRELSKSNLMKEFANSFLFVAYKGERPETLNDRDRDSQNWVAKHYSLGRSDSFCKKVTLIKSDDASPLVRNDPVVKEKEPRLPEDSMFNHLLEPETFYPGDQLLFSVFEMLASDNFELRFTSLVGDFIRFLIDTFSAERNDEAGVPLIRGDAFDVMLWNVIVEEGTGEWKVIDKEWSFKGVLPVDFIIWRNIFQLILRHKAYFSEPLTEESAREFAIKVISTFYPSFNSERYTLAKQMEDYFHHYVFHGKSPEIKILPMGKVKDTHCVSLPIEDNHGSKRNDSDSLRVVAITNDPCQSACPVIRLQSPLKHLQKEGRVQFNCYYVGSQASDADPVDLLDVDLIILQRISNLDIAQKFIQLAHQMNIPALYDIDDLMTELPEYNPFHDETGEKRNEVLQIIRSADAVTVSTTYLQQNFLKYNPNTYVLPNYIDSNIWNGNSSENKNDEIVTFGIFGTNTHSADLRMIHRAIRKILEDFPGKVRFRLMECFIPELEGVQHVEIEKIFYLDYREYALYMSKSQVDAVLVPLVKNDFNVCKSNIKYLEYSIYGIPGIYSTIEPYSKDINHLSNGLLADESVGSWYESMKLMIQDPALRDRLGNNARNDVLKKYDIVHNAYKWYEMYNEIYKKKKKKVSIIIPVLNNLRYTKQCLEALSLNTAYAPYEVIIIDNASTDGTGEYLKCLEGEMKIITNRENLGFAKSCNQGARAAGGGFLVFLNNDTIPEAGWLESLVNVASGDPEIAVVGSKLLYPDNRVQHAGVVFGYRESGLSISHIYRGIDRDHPAVNYLREFQAVTAACMLVKRNVFLELDMFDEGFLNGYEDVDFCLRVREKGLKVFYNPESTLYHFEETTEGRLDHGDRNTRHFFSKWHGKIQPDEETKVLEDGFSIEYLPDNCVQINLTEQEEKSIRNDVKKCEYNKGNKKEDMPIEKKMSEMNSGEKNLKKIAIVRGANLNKWEMQNYEPLTDFYDMTAYTTSQHAFDTGRIEMPIQRLPFQSQGLLLEMQGLEDHLADKDLVYSADITYRFSAQAVEAKQNSGCKVVCLEWENIPFNYDEYPEVHEIKESVRRGADHFIAVTERAKEALLLEGVAEEKIDVVSMGVDLNLFKPDTKNVDSDRAKFGIGRDETIVLYIGRMVWEKGIYDLIHGAAAIVKDDSMREHRVRFLIVGKGPELEGVRERTACLGIDSRIIFLEEYPYEEMGRLHNLADIFVLPSISTRTWQEQFGMVIIESMACGKPVISTRSGSIPEVVGDDGILIQPNDHLSLYGAIKTLVLDQRFREELGARALSRAKERFDAQKTAEKIRIIFEKVLNRETEEERMREHYMKGMQFWKEGKREEGFETLFRTFEEDPDRKNVLDSIVQTGMELKRYDAVEKSIREYLIYHPANLDALASLAQTLVVAGKIDQAEKELGKVFIFDRDNRRAVSIMKKIEAARKEVKV